MMVVGTEGTLHTDSLALLLMLCCWLVVCSHFQVVLRGPGQTATPETLAEV